jgi:GTP diphosphokinase / guanosine-3',5'-bis(diphosphate) 3'-diphosphatase
MNNFSTFVDLYYAVAHDRIGQKEVKFFATSIIKPGWLDFMIHPKRKTLFAEPNSKDPESLADEAKGKKLIIPDTDHPGYIISTCCHPIPGDEIMGLMMSENKPIQIHRTKCSRALELMSSFGNRVVKIDWKNKESISFLAGIKISGIDKMGMINDVSKVISNELNLNIKSFHMEAKNGLTEGEIILFVRDTDTLNSMLRDLRRIDGIKKVFRVD